MIYLENEDFNNGTLNPGDTNDNPLLAFRSNIFAGQFSSIYGSNRSPQNAFYPDTATAWEGVGYVGPSTTHYEVLLMNNAQSLYIDYVGIAGHNLDGWTVQIQSSTNGTGFSPVSTAQVPIDNSDIVFYFDPIFVPFISIWMSKTGTDIAPPIISHAKAGRIDVLERRVYSGEKRVFNITDRNSYMSENGQFLGQTVLRSRKTGTIKQDNLEPARASFTAFAFNDHINGSPWLSGTAAQSFFYAWRPTKYPDDIVYGSTPDNIELETMGGDGLGGRVKWGCKIEAISS